MRRVGALAVLMCVALVSGAAASPAFTAQAARGASIRGPHVVTPGHKVTLSVAGLPRGARFRIQFGVYPIQNCCVSYPIPPVHRRAFRFAGNGAQKVTLKMPGRWAQCVASTCPSPDWHRYHEGQRIFVAVFTDSDAVYAQYLARIG